MLRKYATIHLYTGIVLGAGTLLAGIVYGIKLESFWYFLYCAISAFLIIIGTLAFTALMDSSAAKEEYLKEICEHLQRPGNAKSTPAAQPVHQNTSSGTAAVSNSSGSGASAQTKQGAKETVRPEKDNTDENFIVCPKCGTRQRSNRGVCFDCGAAFQKDEQ